eukprot:997896-Prymnesium_polylepis.1
MHRELCNSYMGIDRTTTDDQAKEIRLIAAGMHTEVGYHKLFEKKGGSTRDDPLKPFKTDDCADKFYPSA